MWIQMSSGRGPIECSRAVVLFMHVLVNELREGGFKLEVLDMEPGQERDTAKSVLISVDLYPEYTLMNKLAGTIQWISKSPYWPRHQRKNLFIDVDLFDEPEVLKFNEIEIKVERMRSCLPDFISFDYDLGNFSIGNVHGYTGLNCAEWLVKYCRDYNLKCPEFVVHSKNPTGNDDINTLLNKYTKQVKS